MKHTKKKNNNKSHNHKISKLKGNSAKGNGTVRIKDWFYLNEKNITVEDIDGCFKDAAHVKSEIWKDAQVAELSLQDGHSIDFELGEAYFSDDYSNNYLKEHNVQSLYYVTIAPDFYANAEPVMKELVQKLGGFFCADTDNFQPVVK